MKYNFQNITKSLILGLIALVCITAGCGEKSDRVTANDDIRTEKASVVRLFSWSDYHDVETFKKFEKETGIKVEYHVFGGTDEMEARLKSEPGYFDVIVADDSVLDQMNELKLIRELDHSKLPNLKNIDTKYLNLAFDQGNKISVPYMWGTTLVAYRKDKISDPGDSWSLLWDSKIKGKVMMLEERFEVLSLPLFLLGHDLNTKNLAYLEDSAAKLVEQIDTVGAVYGDDEEVRTGLDEGTIWAAMCYSGDAAMVADENENVGFFIPKEGAPMWIDSFAIPRDTKVPNAAHRFINFMLDAKIAADNTNYTCYASPNKEAREFISEDLKKNASINPPGEVLERCSFFEKLDNAREQKMNSLWFELRKKLRANDLLVNAEGDSDTTREEE